ncbi:ADP-ribosylglycohydrolase [uncultured Desulfobacterium sp.]|uniref:ADP-ribosylglycohydrolase n=1 Tax=uncultured Desulfobacterium sp. TaxID=201089 RepID=A0A445N3T1_9BACT|nr:ADP-ribosylglycohydrolase [uncultured Desulfobacterium sp.]
MRASIMRDKSEDMVLCSFVADSLALGVHWIYDTTRLAAEYGRIEDLLSPKKSPYHANREKGGFTHYGDQTLVLLESVSACNGFDLLDFSRRWQELFKDYNGYMDEATKGTIGNFAKGRGPEHSGSPSNDLAGAARISPLFLCCRDNLDQLITAARSQTAMTHSDPLTVDSAEFFARVAWKTLRGIAPSVAAVEVVEERFSDSPIAEWTERGLASKSEKSVSAIVRFGQSCHTPEAFPGVVHLIAKYEYELAEALVQAVMAGGDNAARGMMVATVLGAHLGREQLPVRWVEGLKKATEIKHFMDKIG